MRREHAVGIGLLVGAALIAVGATDVLRNAWISMVTPRRAQVPQPQVVFSAYLVQTFLLAAVTFRAYRFDNRGIAASAWILATWEAIAMISRDDLHFVKQARPGLYQLAAFIHVVGAVSLFLAMGARAFRLRREAERHARLTARHRQTRSHRSSRP